MAKKLLTILVNNTSKVAVTDMIYFARIKILRRSEAVTRGVL